MGGSAKTRRDALGPVPTIDPNVVGAPPERHAARVVAAMARWLVEERARLSDAVVDAIRQHKSRFGNPVAQRRLAERLRKAGGKAILDLRLRTGKRGKFMMAIVDWCVFDVARDDVIYVGHRVPEKPWLVCSVTFLVPKQKKQSFSTKLFLLSHHAMQRLAERCRVRTPDDLIAAMQALWDGVAKFINWDEVIKAVLDSDCDVGIPLQKPKFIPVAGGKAVFEWGKTQGHDVLVVTFVLDADMVV
jgi:hypothetical protein